MLQWHRTGVSPISPTTINGISEINGGGMTVPVQRGSMAVLQPPRSRFMITDILGGGGNVNAVNGHHLHHHHHHLHGGGGGAGNSNGSEDGRSLSPSPRDLSLPPGSRHDDSDSDSSGQLDSHSVCSNGESMFLFVLNGWFSRGIIAAVESFYFKSFTFFII